MLHRSKCVGGTVAGEGAEGGSRAQTQPAFPLSKGKRGLQKAHTAGQKCFRKTIFFIWIACHLLLTGSGSRLREVIADNTKAFRLELSPATAFLSAEQGRNF